MENSNFNASKKGQIYAGIGISTFVLIAFLAIHTQEIKNYFDEKERKEFNAEVSKEAAIRAEAQRRLYNGY